MLTDIERYKNAMNLMTRMVAKENLHIIIDEHAKTAMLNLKQRIMVLPIWSDEDPDIADTFRCHEVAHALWTPPHAYHDAILEHIKNKHSTVKNFSLFAGCLNVCEDIRIERLMKGLLPELRNIMPRAAVKIFINHFNKFDSLEEFVDKKWAEWLAVDRVNVVSKVCSHRELLSSEERQILASCLTAESFADVEEAAMALYLLTISQYKERKEEQKKEEKNEQGEEQQEEQEATEAQEDNSKPEQTTQEESEELEGEAPEEKQGQTESEEEDEQGEEDDGEEESKEKPCEEEKEEQEADKAESETLEEGLVEEDFEEMMPETDEPFREREEVKLITDMKGVSVTPLMKLNVQNTVKLMDMFR